jgi:hypothetical protein
MINRITHQAANFLVGQSARHESGQVFQLPQAAPNIELEKSALMAASFRVPGGGWLNASVFTAESFSPENPVMLVRGTDVCGTVFEKEINVRDINPHNASFIELMAFDGYSAANGKQSQTARIAARALVMQELNGKEFSNFNAFTQVDFATAFSGLKESLHTNRNYETLMWVNENLDHFFTHFNLER